MRSERVLWISAAALLLSFWWWRAVAAPLDFFSFQSDPELTYFFNAVLLANGFPVEHTDHPGTALQWLGAVIARGYGITLSSAFEPAEVQRFLVTWRLLALFSMLGTGWLLMRRLQGRGSVVIAIVILCFACDYQTLVYWLTFTPESAFFVMYLPVALACVLHAGGNAPGPCSPRRLLLAGIALGFVTTLKLTLWPVTLFAGAGLAFVHVSGRRGFVRLAAFTGVALIVYAITATVSARDPLAQWRWVAALSQNSGRYGVARPGGGLFPPLSISLEALHRGLALQSYTLLPAVLAVIAFATWALHPARRKSDPASAIWSAAFFASLALTLLLFFKHPYQFKYLMPLSVMMLVYVARSAFASAIPNGRWAGTAVVVIAFVVINAVASQALLYDYVIARDHRVQMRVDTWLTRFAHDRVVFSAGTTHPIAAFKYTMPSPSPLQAHLDRRFGPVDLAPAQVSDFQQITLSKLEVPAGVRRPIAFLSRPLSDDRWRLVDAMVDDRLFVYVLAESAAP